MSNLTNLKEEINVIKNKYKLSEKHFDYFIRMIGKII
jgi:hypothetical protein